MTLLLPPRTSKFIIPVNFVKNDNNGGFVVIKMIAVLQLQEWNDMATVILITTWLRTGAESDH